MNDHLELTDELLVQALRRRTDVPMPPALLARVLAGATSLPRERATATGRFGRPRWSRLPMSAVATAAIAIALVVAAIGFRPVLNQPGASPTAGATATPEATAPASAPASSSPTPEARALGSASALRLSLGRDAAPIDVIVAFDSVWVADIHADDVRRYDPATMREVARIPVPDGPAWFVEADGALWVSTQLGNGLARIDPATNTVVATVGDDPPCGAPFQRDGEIWQAACDGDAFLRIAPAANQVSQRYAAEGHGFLVATDDDFFTSGNDGLARWDPSTGSFTALSAYGGASGALVFADGSTLWVVGGSAVLRVAPTDGHTISSFPYPGAGAVAFDGAGHAWLTAATQGLVEVDIATSSVLETIPVPSPMVARAAAGFVWVTDFNNSVLWRVQP
jgi:streptogramin lyase